MLALNISDEIKGCQEKHDIMFNLDREPLFSGQPMMLEDLHHDEHERLDIENLSILSIEQVRDSLVYVERLLSTLQAIVDEAHDMTEEIEILLETFPPEHPYVVEMSELLGGLVAHWQQTVAKIEKQEHVLLDLIQDELNGLASSIINSCCILGHAENPT